MQPAFQDGQQSITEMIALEAKQIALVAIEKAVEDRLITFQAIANEPFDNSVISQFPATEPDYPMVIQPTPNPTRNAKQASELAVASTTSLTPSKVGSLTCTITTSGNPVQVSFSFTYRKTGIVGNGKLEIRRNTATIMQSIMLAGDLTSYVDKARTFIDNPPQGVNTYEFYWNVENILDSISTISTSDLRFTRFINAKELF